MCLCIMGIMCFAGAILPPGKPCVKVLAANKCRMVDTKVIKLINQGPAHGGAFFNIKKKMSFKFKFAILY